MARSIITSLAGLALGTATLLGSTAISTASPSSVLDRLDAGGVHMESTQWRRGYRGRHYGRPRYGYRGGYRRRGIGTGALVGGLAAGALIGGAIASSQAAPAVTYVAPGPGVADSEVAACAERFKSYDPASGTYLGYDGDRHPCP